MTAQSNITPESIVGDLRYLQLLSRSFPTIADASTEIINLELSWIWPKGQNISWQIYMVNMKHSNMYWKMLQVR